MIKCIESTTWGKNLNFKYLLWVRDHAIKFGLKGIAFFKTDGSLKVIAEGEERNLLFFVKKLERGRSFFRVFSQVENFSVIWHGPRNEFENFSISQSGD